MRDTASIWTVHPTDNLATLFESVRRGHMSLREAESALTPVMDRYSEVMKAIDDMSHLPAEGVRLPIAYANPLSRLFKALREA